ncbi:MAG: guanylate kinase [Chlamydiae bacterium]|jgi:guanylate kinase|nr:guanylate kinase [Chlamydiota bacterium]
MAKRLLGNLAQGLIFIISAPAGTGKTTLVRMLTEEFPCVVESVSCTTRPPRLGEVEGQDYWFLTKNQFERKIQENEFLEYAEVFGYYYGTSRQYVRDLQMIGNHVVLVIDTQGAMNLKQEEFEATYIFLTPPSLEELKERLIKRNTEDAQTLEERLSWASHEMELACAYDYLVVNKDLLLAYGVLRSIVIAEEHKTRNLHL